MRLPARFAVLPLGLVLLLGCGGGGGTQAPPPPPLTVVLTLNLEKVFIRVGESQALSATVSGASNTAVTWSIQEGASGGSITPAGFYTAPNVAGTYHVVATSAADPSKKATAAVTVSLKPWSTALVAGSTLGEGSQDGVGELAGFNGPDSVAVDTAGNAYVSDYLNSTIRKISPLGGVSTLAGTIGRRGHQNGPGASALFQGPTGVVVNAAGDLLVADRTTIRKVSGSGNVSTLAGTPGQGSHADGSASEARFTLISDLVLGGDGTLYLSDRESIRKLSPGGTVTTLAGAPGIEGFSDGTGSGARFKWPKGLALDGDGNLYVVDAGNYVVRRVSPSGVVTTLAGMPGQRGFVDGSGSSARFGLSKGLAMDGAGSLCVVDSVNRALRRVSLSGDVTTWPLVGASFADPTGIAWDSRGYFLLADSTRGVIRKITRDGTVTVLAGSIDHGGYLDGQGSSARLDAPAQVAVDAQGNIYVAEAVNMVIRKITPDGRTSLVAGVPRSPGYKDGPAAQAQFRYPNGIAVDPNGVIYVADTVNQVIRKITPDGMVSTIAGAPLQIGLVDGKGDEARFNAPTSLTLDAAGNLFVADENNGCLRKITPDGGVSTLPRPGIFGPRGIAVDPAGNVFFTNGYNIKKMTPEGVLSTVAGPFQTLDHQDGTGSETFFWYPKGLALDQVGNLYVADWGNHAIRQIEPSGAVSTIVGKGRVPGIVVGSAPGGLTFPMGVALAPNGDLVISSNDAILRATKP